MSKAVKLGSMQYGIIVLTVLTALVHLGLSFAMGGGLATLFILNGLGYLALMVAYFWGGSISAQLVAMRGQIRWAYIAFTAVTIIAFFIMNFGNYQLPGLVDKLIEIILVVLLWRD
ncbi:MAG: hypothetical protein H6668_24925 [Ardenticatenaceae bacterium]|nr:hypothetical protein [Ardenticatenaceae bacterium]